MSDREEFLAQIREIKGKIDFVYGTAQKNKTLLQYIEELCIKRLGQEPLTAELEREINLLLEDTQRDIGKIKNVSNRNNHSSSNIGNVSPNLLPTKQALTSVKIGGFDPYASPILRRLEKQKLAPTSIGTKKKEQKSLEKELPSSDLVNDSKLNKPPKAVQEESFQDTGDDPELLKKPLTDSQEESFQDIPGNVEEDTAPFPEPTPFPIADTYESDEPQLMAAYLQVDQLSLRIELPFESNMARLGRQDFTEITAKTDIEANFFNPIIKRSSDEEPSEHCVVEQPSPGEFILRDRFNSQKTYFLGHFVNQEGTTIKDGDEFILPVNIKSKMASLSVRFHLK